MKRLVLWDIDRTLLSFAGVDTFGVAFLAVTGRPMEHMPEMSGKTDSELVPAVLARHNVVVREGIVEEFYQALANAANDLEADLLAKGRVLAGAAAAVAALQQIPGAVQTVVTGNIRPVARQKLALFGFAGPIDLEIGAYGSESPDRARLVGLARARAELKHGQTLANEHVIVIGDTPHDVRGAKNNGVIAIGVASGSSSIDELKDAGADVVLPSLENVADLLTAVVGTGNDLIS